jgi:glucosamine--fructose-6-phosphate aminotransferase (isomerizing)
MMRHGKIIQLMKDLQGQRATVVAVTSEGDNEVADLATASISIPLAEDRLSTMLEVVPLQLLAYYLATERGVNMDSPRNLAKAVLEE